LKTASPHTPDADGIALEVTPAANARRKIAILRQRRLHWDRVDTDSAKTAPAYRIRASSMIQLTTPHGRCTIQFSFQFPSNHRWPRTAWKAQE